MALLCSKHVLRLSRGLAVKPLVWKLEHAVINKQMTRLLFSESMLGVHGHNRQREHNLARLGSLKGKFQSRMEDYMNAAEKNTIFTDDLKTIWSVAENDSELDTATKMLKRFTAQNTNITFSNFAFGPIVMRTYYLLKKPDEAYKLFMDEELSSVLHTQLTSFLVLMNLLLEAGQYQRVLDIHDILCDKKPMGVKVSYDATTLTLAACCKLDTSECFDYMLKLLPGCQQENALSQRSVLLGAQLALQQNKPEMAMEILTMKDFPNRVPIDYSNMKIQIYAKLGRLEDAIELLGVQIDTAPMSDGRSELNAAVFVSVLEEVRALTKERNDPDLTVQFEKVEKSLEEVGHLRDDDYTEFIFRRITRNRQMKGGYKGTHMSVRAPHSESLRRDSRK